MSDLHFFTEVDLLHTQQANEGFGPDPNKPDLNFNATSRHQPSGSANRLFDKTINEAK